MAGDAQANEPKTAYQVVIAGGGPTGLMLAGELALAGVDTVIVERRATQEVGGPRAGGLYPRTLEVLDQRGIAERFIAAGQRYPTLGYAQIPLHINDFPARHNYILALWQREFEPILATWVAELAVPFLREREVVGFEQDHAGVNVQISDGTTIGAEYLVGCDGGRSLVRKAADIDFAGHDPVTSWLIAETQMRDQPTLGMRPDGGGIGPVNPAAGGEPYRVVLVEREPVSREPTIEDLREGLRATYGTDFDVHSPTWISRFTDMARQAVSYRKGRILLAGDAAHIHSPHGGQGLNTGVQDAVNLGWKLAQVVRGTSPEGLLDTYHAERHPVGARVLQNTMAQVALLSPGPRHQALRDQTAELLALDEPRRRIAGMLSALDIQYELGGEHPIVGRRMPDLDVETTTGRRRVFELLHGAQALLPNFSDAGSLNISGWTDRVQQLDARCTATWDLPVIGEVAAPAAVLVRPDGHVAWASAGNSNGLLEALTTWFGGPSA